MCFTISFALYLLYMLSYIFSMHAFNLFFFPLFLLFQLFPFLVFSSELRISLCHTKVRVRLAYILPSLVTYGIPLVCCCCCNLFGLILHRVVLHLNHFFITMAIRASLCAFIYFILECAWPYFAQGVRCLRKRQINSHLFLHCRTAANLWNMFFCILGIHWVMPRTSFDLLKNWEGVVRRGPQEDCWRSISACIWWTYEEREMKESWWNSQQFPEYQDEEP